MGGSGCQSLEYPISLRATLGSYVQILPLHKLILIGVLFQPYPANLMVGFYATADSSQPIRTDLDNELEGEYPYTAEL